MLAHCVFYENAAGLIGPEQGYLVCRFRPGAQAPAEIRAVFEQARLGLHHHGCTRLLFDQRLAARLSEGDQHWLEHEFLPRLAADAQVHRVAILLAYEVFARLSLLPMVAGLHRQENYARTFDTEADALVWLLR